VAVALSGPHQCPWCFDGCPPPRAVGLSPKVGWLSNTVPVLYNHQSHAQSRNCKLCIFKKKKKSEDRNFFRVLESPDTNLNATVSFVK